MIRKLKSGKYRLYSRKKDPRTGRHKSLEGGLSLTFGWSEKTEALRCIETCRARKS